MEPHAVPSFMLTVARQGRLSTILVPATFATPLRYSRLSEWLGKEKFVVRSSTHQAPMAAAGGATVDAVHAAELLFVRDVLGPLRLRHGAVPEKNAAHLLEIGVIALHRRSETLFGKKWLDFLAARHLPEAPASTPLAAVPPEATAAAAPAPADPSSPALLAPLPTPAPLPAQELPLLPLPVALPAASEQPEEAAEPSLLTMLLGGAGDDGCDSGSAAAAEALAAPGSWLQFDDDFNDGGCGAGDSYLPPPAAAQAAAAVKLEPQAHWALWDVCVPPTPSSPCVPPTPTSGPPAPAPAPATAPHAVALLPPVIQLPAEDDGLQALQPQQYLLCAAQPGLDLPMPMPALPDSIGMPVSLPELLEASPPLYCGQGGCCAGDADLGDEFLTASEMWDMFPPSPGPQ